MNGPSRAVLGAALAALAASCAAQVDRDPSLERPSDARGALDATVPTLSFAADWTASSSGPVLAGGTALVHYDLARLPRCRATYMAFPAWEVEVYWSVDGGVAKSTSVTTVEAATGKRVAADATIDVPAGRDLAVWFHASDESGCTDWDSDFGRNFHFALAPAAPVLHFRADWTLAVDGAPAAGGDLIVDYSLARLPLCRQTYNGLQTWDVTVDWRLDGGAVNRTSLTRIVDATTRVAAPARLTLPAGSRVLEVWFENDDRTGCQRWDSAYGANYRFELAR